LAGKKSVINAYIIMTNCAKMKEKTRTTLVWSIKMFLLVVKKGRGGEHQEVGIGKEKCKKAKI